MTGVSDLMKRYSAFLYITLVYFVGSTSAVAQDYLTYRSVRFPYALQNPGVDYMEFYKNISINTGIARASLPHSLDHAFGEDPKQKLDLYMPKNKPTGAPVFLYVHGGAFREGDRAHYGYVSKPLAAHGIITAITSYRLVGTEPENKINYIDQEEDVIAAFLWLYKNVSKYGGDPNNIYIGGHSAGGVLVANLGTDRKWLTEAGIPKTVLRGVAAVSGGFVDFSDMLSNQRGDTEAIIKRMMRSLRVLDPAPKFALIWGEKETSAPWRKDFAQRIVDGAEAMRVALAAKGVKATIIEEPGADHADVVAAFWDEKSLGTQAVLKMITGSK
jgi:acetyl esterase/lipase